MRCFLAEITVFIAEISILIAEKDTTPSIALGAPQLCSSNNWKLLFEQFLPNFNPKNRQIKNANGRNNSLLLHLLVHEVHVPMHHNKRSHFHWAFGVSIELNRWSPNGFWVHERLTSFNHISCRHRKSLQVKS